MRQEPTAHRTPSLTRGTGCRRVSAPHTEAPERASGIAQGGPSSARQRQNGVTPQWPTSTARARYLLDPTIRPPGSLPTLSPSGGLVKANHQSDHDSETTNPAPRRPTPDESGPLNPQHQRAGRARSSTRARRVEGEPARRRRGRRSGLASGTLRPRRRRLATTLATISGGCSEHPDNTW